jgi:hypothetical protein
MGRIYDVLIRPKSVPLLGSFLFCHVLASLLKVMGRVRTEASELFRVENGQRQVRWRRPVGDLADNKMRSIRGA